MKTIFRIRDRMKRMGGGWVTVLNVNEGKDVTVGTQ